MCILHTLALDFESVHCDEPSIDSIFIVLRRGNVKSEIKILGQLVQKRGLELACPRIVYHWTSGLELLSAFPCHINGIGTKPPKGSPMKHVENSWGSTFGLQRRISKVLSKMACEYPMVLV